MNWNRLTYRQKNKFLAIGYLLFLLLVYRFAISKTLDLYFQGRDISDKMHALRQTSGNVEEIRLKRQMLENRMASFFVDTLHHQDLLIETISSYCSQHHIVLKELPAMTHYMEDDFEVGTYKIVLEGTFIPLLKLAFLLEQNHKGTGRLSSLSFQLRHDYKRKKDVLTMFIYIQNIQDHVQDS